MGIKIQTAPTSLFQVSCSALNHQPYTKDIKIPTYDSNAYNKGVNLLMGALETGVINYNDNKIKFSVDFGRPAAQQNMAPPSTNLWSSASADPIYDIMTIQQNAFDTYGVHINRALISLKAMRTAMASTKFTNSLIGSNPLYTVAGWGPQAALDFIGAQTGVEFTLYDSVYRTRAAGSNTTVNTRFTNANNVIFLPSQADVDSLDDAIGFGKTLTSPHPEGNWTSGYYEWEKTDRDPWGHDMGTGIKAFPVLPHLDLSYVMTVVA